MPITPTPPRTPPTGRWFLESLVDGGKHLRRVPIHPLPFRIGRRPGLDLTLPSELVSKEHAEIYSEGDGLRLRDLRSTNGTFVNRDRIQDVAVREGDILHFAQFEFRLGQQVPEASLQDGEEEPSTVVLGNVELTHQFVEGTRQLTELLEQGAVRPFFQPIVALPEGILTGYEVLGRGLHPGLPENPADLFRIAASMGLEAQLSRLFRQKAIETVRHRTDLPPLFLNTHPAELAEPGLFKSLVELQASAPHQKLTLEIHEGALADPTSIAGLRSELAGLGIGLAYDDFGAGQARLLELAEVPPHFLKFDMRFIRGIDEAPPSRRRLLSSLVSVARDLLVQTVAEGVETEAEADVCAKIGFSHAQGFHFGRPVPLEKL
jgi:EAL domain-containing protein (putative c-di-GMP-specific phosphodiesterase class I)